MYRESLYYYKYISHTEVKNKCLKWLPSACRHASTCLISFAKTRGCRNINNKNEAVLSFVVYVLTLYKVPYILSYVEIAEM